MTGRCLRLSASYFNSRPHGGRRDSDRIKDVFAYISTHALTEGDKREPTKQQKENISTHALTEGDPAIRNHLHFTRISTHALTEGDYDCFFCGILRAISTHALTEGDSVRLSTSAPRSISTHALTEGDDFKTTSNRLSHIFQLTPSRRATSAPPVATIIIETFQLTPSRRATLAPIGARSGLDISTHALTEGDKIPMNAEPSSEHFNSRPHGGRRSSHWSSRSRKRISTHALTEGDYRRSQSHISVSISTHALTEGDSSASS